MKIVVTMVRKTTGHRCNMMKFVLLFCLTILTTMVQAQTIAKVSGETSAIGGAQLRFTLSVNEDAPAHGFMFLKTSRNKIVKAPEELRIARGKRSIDFTIESSTVNRVSNETVSYVCENVNVNVSLEIKPVPEKKSLNNKILPLVLDISKFKFLPKRIALLENQSLVIEGEIDDSIDSKAKLKINGKVVAIARRIYSSSGTIFRFEVKKEQIPLIGVVSVIVLGENRETESENITVSFDSNLRYSVGLSPLDKEALRVNVTVFGPSRVDEIVLDNGDHIELNRNDSVAVDNPNSKFNVVKSCWVVRQGIATRVDKVVLDPMFAYIILNLNAPEFHKFFGDRIDSIQDLCKWYVQARIRLSTGFNAHARAGYRPLERYADEGKNAFEPTWELKLRTNPEKEPVIEYNAKEKVDDFSASSFLGQLYLDEREILLDKVPESLWSGSIFDEIDELISQLKKVKVNGEIVSLRYPKLISRLSNAKEYFYALRKQLADWLQKGALLSNYLVYTEAEKLDVFSSPTLGDCMLPGLRNFVKYYRFGPNEVIYGVGGKNSRKTDFNLNHLISFFQNARNDESELAIILNKMGLDVQMSRVGLVGKNFDFVTWYRNYLEIRNKKKSTYFEIPKGSILLKWVYWKDLDFINLGYSRG
jgi:hypothetical protein